MRMGVQIHANGCPDSCECANEEAARHLLAELGGVHIAESSQPCGNGRNRVRISVFGRPMGDVGLNMTPDEYPERYLKSGQAVSLLESSFLEMVGSLHRTLGWEYLKLGWRGVKKRKLVSWGICDLMNRHRINLQLHNNAEDSQVQRYLKEQSSAYFVNCVAQFTRACIDLWEGPKETSRFSVEVERFFSFGGHKGKRPDILILPRAKNRPAVVIECKTGLGYSREIWSQTSWKRKLDEQRKDTKDALEKHLGRKIDYLVFIFYPERWMLEKAAEFKNEGVYILLRRGPNYLTNEEYERACKEYGSQLFLHPAEGMLTVVKKSIGR